MMFRQSAPAMIIACAVLTAGSIQLHAQGAPLAAGDIFIDERGDTMQVTQCRGEGWSMECQVKRLASRTGGDILYSSWGWHPLHLLRASEAIWIKAGNAPYAGPKVELNAAKNGREPMTVADRPRQPVDTSSGSVSACPVPIRAVSDAAPFSQAVYRWEIYDQHARAVNGGVRAPLAVGISFESITMGQRFPNIVTNDPARGARRINDAAPPNAMIYNVASTYLVCEQYGNETQRRRVTAEHQCFKSAVGEWRCGVSGRFTTSRL